MGRAVHLSRHSVHLSQSQQHPASWDLGRPLPWPPWKWSLNTQVSCPKTLGGVFQVINSTGLTATFVNQVLPYPQGAAAAPGRSHLLWTSPQKKAQRLSR